MTATTILERIMINLKNAQFTLIFLSNGPHA